jgi:multiple antibiotic resistance protein
MHALIARTLFVFLALFPILNPPATAPVFLQLTGHIPDRERNRLAFLIGLYTFGFLTTLLVVGGWALKLLGISIPVISIAGGLLVFHSAWNMLNKAPKVSESEQADIRSSMHDKAFYPLTFPVTAGPGSIAVTLSLVPAGNILESHILFRYLSVAGGIALAATSVFLFYRFSGPFLRRLGRTGQAAILQLGAFVLLAIGVQIVWTGLRDLILTL